jgi:hypothetical protein
VVFATCAFRLNVLISSILELDPPTSRRLETALFVPLCLLSLIVQVEGCMRWKAENSDGKTSMEPMSVGTMPMEITHHKMSYQLPVNCIKGGSSDVCLFENATSSSRTQASDDDHHQQSSRRACFRGKRCLPSADELHAELMQVA